jgi:hypothetical protein
MAQLRADLLREMPEKMEPLVRRLDTWCRGVAMGVRALSDSAESKPGHPKDE